MTDGAILAAAALLVLGFLVFGIVGTERRLCITYADDPFLCIQGLEGNVELECAPTLAPAELMAARQP